jgi:hypothetical protein
MPPRRLLSLRHVSISQVLNEMELNLWDLIYLLQLLLYVDRVEVISRVGLAWLVVFGISFHDCYNFISLN